MKATILLEDGTIIEGKSFGANKTIFGEIVFNTGMTGYQEILTDPSYAGQIVVMTYPLIGNYGTILTDIESSKVQVSGFVVKEYCNDPGNLKNRKSISEYLIENNIFAVCDVDTRMLTKKIRSTGTMNCVMTTQEVTDELQQELKSYKFPSNIVSKVSRINKDVITTSATKKIGVIDLGVKNGILKHLIALGCNLTVFPWDVSHNEILASGLDAVLFSNGPGDPKEVKATIKTAENIIGKIPAFGICLGHQILSLALGGDTYKLKFGHRGSNHPVINIMTNKVLITAQNHGYAVYENSLKNDVKITYKNINDGTVEGFSCEKLKIHTVQFHPEAGPGPRDANEIFGEWLNLLEDVNQYA
jgi:carbamoyl-phosphate synthase small subunit